jgi:hypothetical protein
MISISFLSRYAINIPTTMFKETRCTTLNRNTNQGNIGKALNGPF